jgi:hypothetical protein
MDEVQSEIANGDWMLMIVGFLGWKETNTTTSFLGRIREIV